ncbi:putative low-complexity protein [Chamaesiphon minutus PCC 6605]|uniref:Putative low-complexity protein n=2 Tax=Chamaesiphon TaxID=217161 RepID=K9UFN1_CHAP6|nr:putative low-complexity protein [Chamaesiphon minutus PCC 6605]
MLRNVKIWLYLTCPDSSFTILRSHSVGFVESQHNCLLEYMPTIIALILASILVFFPGQVMLPGGGNAYAAGGTSQYKPSLSYDNAVLNGEDFSGKNLQTAVFTTAKLDDTNFAGADLTGVVISSSTLNRTNLHGANLTQGLLDQVRFVGADLSDAVFVEAMMLRSTFTDVNIAGADFTDAILGKLQQKELCQIATGVNSKTGVATRDSLGCK